MQFYFPFWPDAEDVLDVPSSSPCPRHLLLCGTHLLPSLSPAFAWYFIMIYADLLSCVTGSSMA